MSKEEQFELLIVGGGPAGITAAIRLIRARPLTPCILTIQVITSQPILTIRQSPLRLPLLAIR